MKRMLIAASAWLLISAAPAPNTGLNARIFDRVWSLVASRYWDRDRPGLDWTTARATYRPDALAAADSTQLYRVINRMLGQTGDSHVYARSPSQLPPPPRRDDDAGWNRRASWAADGVLLLAFDQFEPGDDRWMARSLQAYRPRAVILDLRRNVGGDADVLDRIAGLFVPDNHVLIRLTGRRLIDERSKGTGKRAFTGPMVLLTGHRSASAAEILAAFLDDSGRAITVGERTRGAVTGGVDHRLPDGGRLTIAEYDIHLPSGRRLEREGVVPRHVVPPSPGRDAQLDAAVRLLTQGGA